jgi:hypothetical protein
VNLFSFSFFDGDFGFGRTTKKEPMFFTGHRDVMKRKDIRRSTRPNEFLYFFFFILYFQICSFKKTFRNREGKVERKSMRTLFCANNLVGKGFFFILKSDPLHFCFFKFFHLRTTVMRKELRQKN